MWNLAIPYNRPPASAPNAWEPREFQTPGILSTERPSAHVITAAGSKCSPVLQASYHSGLTARPACMNMSSSANAIATGSTNAGSASTGMTTIQAINSIRRAQDEWIENQLRKIETLYTLHKERQDEQRN